MADEPVFGQETRAAAASVLAEQDAFFADEQAAVCWQLFAFRKRRELHARFADALLVSGRELEAMELLAIHFFQAGRHDQAWRFSRSAGDRALAKYANAEARRFYRQALDAGRRLHEVSEQDLAEVQEALGEVTERLGDFPNARAAYRAARRMLPQRRR